MMTSTSPTVLTNPLFLIAGMAVLVFASACTGNKECSSDSDCPPSYECATAGGVFASDAVCAPVDTNQGDPQDAGGNDTSPQPSCDDNTQSGDQTDVDCGGSQCPPCEVGKNCQTASDCATNLCVEGVCTEPDGGCPSGQTECNGVCADLSSDTAHCGDCDNACGDGESCTGGSCICDADCCADDDCGTGEVCDGGACTCATECCHDDDCPGMGRCDGDGFCECIFACCVDDDCPGLETCDDGYCECEQECCEDSDCPGFKECQGGSCVCDHPVCCHAGDCPSGMDCSHYQECIELDGECDNTCDCTLGQQCSGGADGGDCRSGLPGPLPHESECCVSPFCTSGEQCTNLDGSSSICQ